MTVDQMTNLVLGVLAGIAAIITALAAVILALRTDGRIDSLGKGLNGRLDQLLVEREQRIRAEAAAEAERVRIAGLSGFTQQIRPEPIVREFPPDTSDR